MQTSFIQAFRNILRFNIIKTLNSLFYQLEAEQLNNDWPLNDLLEPQKFVYHTPYSQAYAHQDVEFWESHENKADFIVASEKCAANLCRIRARQ